MSLSLVIAINVIVDFGLIALLAAVMSRAAKLTPHIVAAPVAPAAPIRAALHSSA